MKQIMKLVLFMLVCLTLTSCNSKTSDTTDDTSENQTANNDEPQSRDVFAMDTYMTLTAYGNNADEALNEAEAEIERLDAMLSTGDENSEIYSLNQNGTGTISEDTETLLDESEKLYTDTDGVFDITIYPVMDAWGFTTQNYRIPSDTELTGLLKNVNASRIQYNRDEKKVTLPTDVKIDFGGIAKGYTSSRIMEIYKKCKVTSGMVSLGGNVQLLGAKPDGSSWRIAVQSPDDTNDYLGVLEAKDKAVITSGGYERYFEENGTTYHHIIDPTTGYTFTYQVPVTDSDYTYVYAGLSWSEYWASEGVLAAGSTESSEELDSRGESDKGAFDVVTRATTNHGLHRGSFQCTAVIETKDGTTYNLAYWKDKDTFVTTDGQEVAFANVKANIKDYKVTGLKYVPVKVKTSDYKAFKEKYTIVEKDGTLAGGYGEVNLKSYTAAADVTENTNGLKTATKNADGTFSFSKRAAGTYSGLKDSQLKSATDLEPTVKEGDGSYGEFLRVDFNGNYGDLGANMQAVKWTYYGDDATYTNAMASYGTKFAADNWMHKSMGIQLGLTDSVRCQLPAGTNGTGYWSLTIYALGYEDYTYTFQVGEENIAQPKAADQKDIDALQAKVDEAKGLNKVNYTADSWSSMETELTESEELLKKDSLLSAEVKTQLQHMTDALDRLVQKEADLTKLNEAIGRAEGSNYNEADYTADSWKAYTDALAAAKALTTSENTLLQSDVDAAMDNLNKAISNLTEAETPVDPNVVSTTSLEKAIKAAEDLKEADYTADSWKELQNALSAAKAALNEKKDQATVDAATENLNKAISALVKAGSAEEKKTPAAQTSELKNTSGTDTKKTSGKVKTGDPASVFGWLTLAVSSLGAGGFALKRRKRRDDK